MADNIVVLNGAGGEVTMRAVDLGGGLLAWVHLEEAAQRAALLAELNPRSMVVTRKTITTVGDVQLLAARAGRKRAHIIPHEAVDFYVGPATGVTVAPGGQAGALALGARGTPFVVEGGSAAFGAVEAGTLIVSVVEFF